VEGGLERIEEYLDTKYIRADELTLGLAQA